jgi:DNA-binding MarR family transcriptional regulator
MTSSRLTLAHGLGDAHIGLEARAHLDDHLDTRMWLRLLACSNQIEQEIRQRLRQHFGTTLPRFDYLAQLERHPEGLRMNVLSRYLMVTGGNVTGVTDQLVADGLVERLEHPQDRRSWRVQLTAAGRESFTRMAAVHEQWLAELFGGMATADKQTLYGQLGHLRVLLARQQEAGPAAESADRTTPAQLVNTPAVATPAARPATPPQAIRSKAKP